MLTSEARNCPDLHGYMTAQSGTAVQMRYPRPIGAWQKSPNKSPCRPPCPLPKLHTNYGSIRKRFAATFLKAASRLAALGRG